MTGDPIAFQVFNEISIIDQLVRTMFTKALPKGMTIAQFTVLNHFVRLGLDEKSPAALADAFQLTRATMTSTLARMERAGLIAVRADPKDGRAKLVSLTDAGYTMRGRCVEATAPLVPMLEPVIPDQDLANILPQLQRIRAALDAMRS